MLINNEVISYLKGKIFSNELKIKFKNVDDRFDPFKGKIVCRDEYLMRLVQDKVVLHIGFLDHLPLIDKKIKEGLWLHTKLLETARLCFGVDVDKKGIEYVRSNFNISNIFYADFLEDNVPSEIRNCKFDYVLLPDVIEHIDNPVFFLHKIKITLGKSKRLVITTPNAFRLENLKNVFKGIEVLNSDHRFWFTPYTLSKITIRAGYEIINLKYAEHRYSPRRKLISKVIIKLFPQTRDTLICEAKF